MIPAVFRSAHDASRIRDGGNKLVVSRLHPFLAIATNAIRELGRNLLAARKAPIRCRARQTTLGAITRFLGHNGFGPALSLNNPLVDVSQINGWEERGATRFMRG